MEPISWAAAALGVGVSITFFTFLYRMWKKPDDPLTKEVEALQKIVAVQAEQIKNLEGDITAVDENRKVLDARVLKRMDDLDAKQDKITELLINYISNR